MICWLTVWPNVHGQFLKVGDVYDLVPADSWQHKLYSSGSLDSELQPAGQHPHGLAHGL